MTQLEENGIITAGIKMLPYPNVCINIELELFVWQEITTCIKGPQTFLTGDWFTVPQARLGARL